MSSQQQYRLSAPTVGKQWLLVSVWFGMEVIDLDTASGLKWAYARPFEAFSTQDVKCCFVD